MNKTVAIQQIILATTDQPIIFTTGYSCRIAAHLCHRPNHFYMTGSMGLATSIGTGVALATGLPTVVVDGDGSLMMNPTSLIVVGAIPNLPLLHVVLDDGVYASTGSQEVSSKQVNLTRLAHVSGYSQVFHVGNVDAFAVQLHGALANCFSPIFIHCTLSAENTAVPPRIDLNLAQHQRQFSQYLRTVTGFNGQKSQL